MLFVVGANAAVIGAAIYRFRMGFPGVFAGFVVVPDLLVVFDIDSDKYLLEAVFLTGLGQIDVVIFKNDLGAQLPVAFDAKADRMIVVNIIPLIFHIRLMLKS